MSKLQAIDTRIWKIEDSRKTQRFRVTAEHRKNITTEVTGNFQI